MSRRAKQLSGEQAWRDMSSKQRRQRGNTKKPRGKFTLYHFILITSALLVVVAIDYFTPALRGMLQ